MMALTDRPHRHDEMANPGRPNVFAQIRHGLGVDSIIEHLLAARRAVVPGAAA